MDQMKVVWKSGVLVTWALRMIQDGKRGDRRWEIGNRTLH